MKFYKFALLKAYFDKGYGITSYFKYLIAVLGISGLGLKYTAIIFLIYGILCFVIGKIWYKWGFTDAENEVQNRFNPFVKEMRTTYTNEKI